MNSNKVIVILLVFLCATFAYQTFFQKTNTNIEKAYATDGSSNTEMLVVPFNVNSSEQKLAVFKKEDVLYKGSKLPNQWCMTVYGMRDGRKLRLEASRWIENDFFLKDFNIAEKRKTFMHPETLRERKVKGYEFDPTDDKKDETKKPDINAPDWFVKPPVEPKKAIYAIGTVTMKNIDELQLAKVAAAAIARREILRSLQTSMIKVISSYTEKIKIKVQKEKFKSLSHDFVKKVSDLVEIPTLHVKNEIIHTEGKLILFSLIKINFDKISEIFSEAQQKEFEEIGDEAKEAFDEMKKQAVAMTEKAFYTESAKPYLPE